MKEIYSFEVNKKVEKKVEEKKQEDGKEVTVTSTETEEVPTNIVIRHVRLTPNINDSLFIISPGLFTRI